MDTHGSHTHSQEAGAGHHPPCPAIPFAGPLLSAAAPVDRLWKGPEGRRKSLRTSPANSLAAVTATAQTEDTEDKPSPPLSPGLEEQQQKGVF